MDENNFNNTTFIAPVVLFVYNRPWHVKQTIDALKCNDLAKRTDIFIYSDAPKNEAEIENVNAVRNYIRTVTGFKSVTTTLRENNYGMEKSIISGVTEIAERYERVIVMEDDLVCSKYFLNFMNDGLEFYEKDERVIGIHGYSYPIKFKAPEAFFLKDPGCLGWATWKRGWDLFEEDGKKLLNELHNRNLAGEFNYGNSYWYTKMLKKQVEGKIESWAVRWYASAFLRDKLSLYPAKSLIKHIGNDGSGTNFGSSDILDIDIAEDPVTLREIPVVEDAEVRRHIGIYFRGIRPSIMRRIENKIGEMIGKGFS